MHEIETSYEVEYGSISIVVGDPDAAEEYSRAGCRVTAESRPVR